MRKQSIFLLFLLLLSSTVIVAQERITNFESNIVVHNNASMTVTENITVNAAGRSIRHGLVREFPIQYTDRLGNYYKVDFKLINVLRDGESEPYRVDTVANGKKIYIGRKHVLLRPGVYTYSITYETSRQLGHYGKRDELYWNVTGNGWRLPIDRASARVTLPRGVPGDRVGKIAYTGFQGARGSAYVPKVGADGSILFETNKKLYQRQGLTIVVDWPAGFVVRPTMVQKFYWFLRDNQSILILLLVLILLFLFFMYIYVTKCRVHSLSTIVPLFYPPAGLSSGAVLYLSNKNYHHKSLAAEIVDMARAGYLTIEQKKGFWNNKYVLKNRLSLIDEKPVTVAPKIHNKLHTILFEASDTITLDKSSRSELIEARDFLKDSYALEYSEKWFENFHSAFGIAIGLACAVGIGPVVSLFRQARIGALFFTLVPFVFMSLIFYKLFKIYTVPGKKLLDEVLGFKMFLEVTEKERMKLVGTPPERTPELYEKYLPYAIALGVEQAWSNQFAPVFAKMEQQGNAYVPLWYCGLARGRFRASNFSSNLSKSFSAAIASSAKAPGSGSGFGSGGSSGGGGGGGGGGGW